MKYLIPFLSLSTLAASSAIQHPLHEADSQALINTKRPLVSSGALQDHIFAKNLLKRAEELYEIARLGKKQYGHPTRVIGSEGNWRFFQDNALEFMG